MAENEKAPDRSDNKPAEKDRERKAMGAFAHALIAALYDTREGVAEVKSSAVETGKHLAVIDSTCVDLSKQLAETNRTLAALARQNECLEQAGRERQALSEEHYNMAITEPMARQIFPLIDLIADALAGVPPDAPDSNQRDLLLGLRAQLFDFLLVYGIEPICAQPGAPFDARLMQPAKTLATPDPTQHLRLATSLRCGFRRGERVLRYQSVVVQRCEACASA